MYALDFEYDGRRLSDYGFLICDFDHSDGTNVASVGSTITFNKVAKNKGKNWSLTDTHYDECYQATFDICKNPDLYFNELEITEDEYRDIMRWLNRHEFCRFEVMDAEDKIQVPCHYQASFNVQKIKIREILYGMRLTLETDKPFGYGEMEQIKVAISVPNQAYTVYDNSEEIGLITPDMKIVCGGVGDLQLSNETYGITMLVKNCEVAEELTVDGSALTLSSSLPHLKLYNDFNFHFFKLGNTLDDRRNVIKSTLPCAIEISYMPIIKDAP